MSARNYLSAREKNHHKPLDCLPNISQQNYSRRSGYDPPGSSANYYPLTKRNVNFPYGVKPSFVWETTSRVPTPFSDFLSESDTGPGTPDLRSEESDSSAGSVLNRANAEASRALADEWERIERTIYGEEGEKVLRPQMLEECQQWRELFPHLRVMGKGISIPEKSPRYRQIEPEETIAIHYSDYQQFSESEERLSESSTDVTPQNSPRIWSEEDHLTYEPKLLQRKASSVRYQNNEINLPDSFGTLLQITPLQLRSPSIRSSIGKRHYSSILKSEVSSSRWMRQYSPDSSLGNERSSAKSFVSLDPRKYSSAALSANERKKAHNARVSTARFRDSTKLQPLCPPTVSLMDTSKRLSIGVNHYGNAKISLPPLQLEEEKKKVRSVNSGKCLFVSKKARKAVPRSFYQLSDVTPRRDQVTSSVWQD